jgi:hypothetical protein
MNWTGFRADFWRSRIARLKTVHKYILRKFWFFAVHVRQNGYDDPVSRSRFDQNDWLVVSTDQMKVKMR